MAKSRSRKKKGNQPVKLTPKAYIKKRARLLPVTKCYINEDWQDSGMATVIVTRQMAGGKLVIGSYIVDVFCLGLKDTHFWFGLTEDDFEEDLLPIFTEKMQLDLIECQPNFAFNLIYGAVEYAEDLGFSPHKDFALTELILDTVESISFIDIEFGKDGQPFLIPGPNDNVNHILSVLNKSIGEENFRF